MDAPKRIGLVRNGLGGWRLWSVDEPGVGGVDAPDAEYLLASEHDRLMAEKDARIAELEAALATARGEERERCAKVAHDLCEKWWREYKDRLSDYAGLTHHEGMSDGAADIVVAIRALTDAETGGEDG